MIYKYKALQNADHDWLFHTRKHMFKKEKVPPTHQQMHFHLNLICQRLPISSVIPKLLFHSTSLTKMYLCLLMHMFVKPVSSYLLHPSNLSSLNRTDLKKSFHKLISDVCDSCPRNRSYTRWSQTFI